MSDEKKSLVGRYLENIDTTKSAKVEAMDVTILGVSSISPLTSKTGEELPRSIVITEEHGNFFTFSNAIVNAPTHFGAKGVKGTIVLKESAPTEDGTSFVNVSKVTFSTVNYELLDALASRGIAVTLGK